MANKITHLPEQKRKLLETLVEKLSKITGVSAVVLGGSYASRTHHANAEIRISTSIIARFTLSPLQR